MLRNPDTIRKSYPYTAAVGRKQSSTWVMKFGSRPVGIGAALTEYVACQKKMTSAIMTAKTAKTTPAMRERRSKKIRT